MSSKAMFLALQTFKLNSTHQFVEAALERQKVAERQAREQEEAERQLAFQRHRELEEQAELERQQEIEKQEALSKQQALPHPSSPSSSSEEGVDYSLAAMAAKSATHSATAPVSSGSIVSDATRSTTTYRHSVKSEATLSAATLGKAGASTHSIPDGPASAVAAAPSTVNGNSGASDAVAAPQASSYKDFRQVYELGKLEKLDGGEGGGGSGSNRSLKDFRQVYNDANASGTGLSLSKLGIINN